MSDFDRLLIYMNKDRGIPREAPRATTSTFIMKVSLVKLNHLNTLTQYVVYFLPPVLSF